jgi:hypothetical protein
MRARQRRGLVARGRRWVSAFVDTHVAGKLSARELFALALEKHRE